MDADPPSYGVKIARRFTEELAYCDVNVEDASSGGAPKTKEGEKSGGLLSELFEGGADDEDVSGTKAASDLVESWHAMNETCRGGSGDDPKTLEACNERDEVGSELANANWCYGKDGQSGSQYEWHRCAKGSLRN